MEEKVLEKLISEAFSYSEGEVCIFSWQGGEPLLAGLDFYCRVVELQKRYGKSGQVVGNAFQTNATLLDKRWVEFFREYSFLVGVSLDGPEEVHNHYRCFPDGRGSFSKVMKGISLLKEGGVEFNILSTLGRETMGEVEKIYEFFLKENFSYLQFIPAVDRVGGKIASFSPTPSQYGDFLCRLFDLWWNEGNPLVSVRLFDNIMEILLQGESSSCMWKPECGEYLVVEFNGDVYPCDFFVKKEWKLGNIFTHSLAELYRRAREIFGRLKKTTPPSCQGCEWNFICNNGCLWFRWVGSGDVRGRSYLCSSYKKFFSYSMERFHILKERILARRG